MSPSNQTAGRAEPVAPSRKFSAPFSGKSKTNSVAPKRGRLLSRGNSSFERGGSRFQGETSRFGSGKVPQGLVVGPPVLRAIISHVLEQEVTCRLQVADTT